jgi:hypothetical protein
MAVVKFVEVLIIFLNRIISFTLCSFFDIENSSSTLVKPRKCASSVVSNSETNVSKH